LDSRNTQVAFLLEFAATDCSIQLPSPTLAEAFGIRPSCVRTICTKAKRAQKSPSPPFTLSRHPEEAVRQMTRNGVRAGHYVAQREVLNFVETEFQKIVTYGWLDSLLSRGVDEVRRVVIAPQELRGGRFRDRIWVTPSPSSSPGFRLSRQNYFSILMKLVHPIGKRGSRNRSSFRQLERTLICIIPEIDESVIRRSSAACRHQEMPITHCFSVQIPPPCQYFRWESAMGFTFESNSVITISQ
jgi:hypothetical protein